MDTPAPAARTTDLDTSHAAAASVRGTENLRSRLFRLLTAYPGGLTHEQIVTAYEGYVRAQGWPTATAQGIRSRVKELEREGRVRRDEHATELTSTGRHTHRWFPVFEDDAHRARVEAVLVESFTTGLAPVALALSKLHVDRQAQERPAITSGDPYNDMARDIQEARRRGQVSSNQMARYLIEVGWRR